MERSAAYSTRPSFFHLVLLVLEAVLEVVFLSLPGYIAARRGMFDAVAQKLVASLNLTLFTPCLSMELRSLLVPDYMDEGLGRSDGLRRI